MLPLSWSLDGGKDDGVDSNLCLQEMKLFEIAMSLADVLLCLPGALTNRESMRIGPRDVLGHLVHFLAGFRGGGDRAKLQLLYSKTYSSTVPGVLSIPGCPNETRITDSCPTQRGTPGGCFPVDALSKGYHLLKQ